MPKNWRGLFRALKHEWESEMDILKAVDRVTMWDDADIQVKQLESSGSKNSSQESFKISAVIPDADEKFLTTS